MDCNDRWSSLRLLCIATALGSTIFSGGVLGSQAAPIVAAAPKVRAEAATITLDVDHLPLLTVLGLAAQQAGLRPAYEKGVIPTDVHVTLHVRDMAVETVFQQILNGTGLVAQIRPDGVVIVVRPSESVSGLGIITGVVRDAVTKKPITGATITLDGAKSGIVSDANGAFKIPGVTPGTHRVTVRLLGYQAFTSVVTVINDGTASVDASLAAATIRLDEVVTTATGEQRRVEVGNVIAHLNVDSIAKTAPVTSLTDLLSARAAGVQVIETNGLVGSGPAIRIRGRSSIALSGNPIIIVDGIRQDNTEGGTYNSITGGMASPNRLNDIDFSQVASIDILKGPSAATEYGTDAANGVIVITTKHGQAGRTRWHVSGDRGWNNVPIGFSELYLGWAGTGFTYKHVFYPDNCTLAPMYSGGKSVLAGTCHADSVTHFNPLNHKAYSLFGSGLDEKVNIDVGGGTDALQYFLAGGFARDIGAMRLPDVFRAQAAAAGVPKSELQPNTQVQPSARAALTAQLTPTLDVSLNTSYMTTRQVSPSVNEIFNGLVADVGSSIPDSAHAYGYGDWGSTPLSRYGLASGQSQDTRRTTLGVTTDWNSFAWLSARATGGADLGTSTTQVSMSPQSLVAAGSNPDQGSLSVTTGTNNILTSDLQATVSHSVTKVLTSKTSLGWQAVSTRTRGVTASVVGNLTAANPTLNGVPNPQVMQQGTGSGTVGGYLEERLAFADQLFLTGALRLDGASGFGHDYHTTAYPKASLSWLAWDNGTSNVRLRSAFGASGIQPQNGAAYPLYLSTVVFGGAGDVPSAQLSSPGNPNLKPERSQEFEFGMDVGLWSDRVNLELTQYVKHTTDALVTEALGGTFGPSYAVQQNIGTVRNTGFEGTLQARLLDGERFGWNVTINASSNQNKLQRINAGVVTSLGAGIVQSNVVGYPLFGYWGYQVTYADTNHDGLIAPSEVTVANTGTYMGSSVPKMEMSIANRWGFLRNMFAVSALIDIRRGGVVYNGPALQAASTGVLREQHDSTAPLWLQARAVAQATPNGRYISLAFEDGSFVRFRELSMTYSLPARLMHRTPLSSLGVSLAVRNLALWTHYTGGDPEVSSVESGPDYLTYITGNDVARNDIRAGLSSSVIPLMRTWLLRFNAGF